MGADLHDCKLKIQDFGLAQRYTPGGGQILVIDEMLTPF